MSFGGGWHGYGVSSRAAASASGLPFGGIPTELQDGVDKLLAEEPAQPEPHVDFSYRAPAGHRRISIARLVFGHWQLGVAAVAFVVLGTLTAQAGPMLVSVGIDRGMDRGDMRVVVAVTLGFLAAIVVSAVAQRWQTQVTGRLAAGVMHDLRLQVFQHLQRLDLGFYTREKAGLLMTRMTADIENLQQLVQDGLAQIAVQALTMVVVTALLFAMNWVLALITVALVVPALTALSLWFRTTAMQGYDRVRDAIARVLADLTESLHGVRVVAGYNRFQHNTIVHRNVVGDYREANNYTALLAAVYGPGSQLIGYVGQAVLLAIGGTMALHHQLQVGELVAFFLYFNRFFQPIQLLVQQYNSLQRGQASIVKLNGLLETRPAVVDAVGAAELPPIDGAITFESVSFGYDAGRPVLMDVDLDIAPGESVALVGPTGAGKSTIAKLITRFYDPTRGQVQIDGHDLAGVTVQSLRRQLGVVPQEPFLFVGTLRDNLTFADPALPESEVWDAIGAVGLGDLVARLPDGLDSEVHERGQSLSSGERQLVALARAFLRHPRVLVLDEATSNLDLASEAQVEAALDVVLQGRTAVLIAHRLTTAMKADRIVVVDGGRIVEQGTHADLLARGGRYSRMYDAWVHHADADLG